MSSARVNIALIHHGPLSTVLIQFAWSHAVKLWTRHLTIYRACHFHEAVVSEVECIPYDGSMYKHENLRRNCSGKVMKPFGIVSLVQTTEKSGEKAIDPVIKFLEQEMKDRCSAFNDYKTLETAIGAYKCMCPGKVLKAEDIWVAIMDVSGSKTSGAFRHLDIDIIREELEIINGGCSRTNFRHLMHRNPLRDSSNAPNLYDILMSLQSDTNKVGPALSFASTESLD